MTKTVVVIAAGLLALAGVALADQSVHVNGNIHNPVTGDYPVHWETSGLPSDQASVPLEAQADEANRGLGDAGVPAEAQVNENGIRPNLRCAQDMPREACVTDEPTLPYPGVSYVNMGPRGVGPSNWISVTSGQAVEQLPPEIPAEQRQIIEDAHDQLNADVQAEFQEGSGNPGDHGIGFRLPGVDGAVKVGFDDLLGPGDAGLGLVQPGEEATFSRDAMDEFFEVAGTPLSGTGGAEAQGAAGGDDAPAGGSGNDLAAMAAMAALVGAPIAGGLALYHRIRSTHALNNKTRQMVYDAVVTNPGIGVNDAARAANCSYSTAAYHLERLVDARLLVASEDGRRARYFKNGGAFSQQEREFVPVLQSKEAMDVLQVIVENPWCYRAEVAQRLGVSGPTVNWHLKKLMAAGVVKEMREGRVSYLYADKKLLQQIGANLIGKVPEELVQRLRFERRPEPELVEPAMGLPETSVPEVGLHEDLELTPLPEARA